MAKKEQELLPWRSQCGLCGQKLTTWTEYHYHAKNGCVPQENKSVAVPKL